LPPLRALAPTSLRQRLSGRLAELRERIAKAALAAGRESDSVRLVAVTKQASLEAARELVHLGARDLGESRAQSLLPKARALAAEPGPPRWHFLGHLQTNKVRDVLSCAEWIHSIDSLRLLEAVEAAAAKDGRQPRLFLQVQPRCAPERAGFLPGELPGVLERARSLAFARLAGLMVMAPLPPRGAEDQAARALAAESFRDLARLRGQIDPSAFEGGRAMLSMGMSSDFELAIAHGADWVRLGSALFHGLEPAPETP
jgi:pyridoxal phosphate enzyme (YggS family)